MKYKTGALVMVLLLAAITFVGSASDKSPPTQKAKIHVEQIDQAISQVVDFVPVVMHVAIVPAPAYVDMCVITHAIQYQEQAHSNGLICTASKQHLEFNRMRNARWQSSFENSDDHDDLGESG